MNAIMTPELDLLAEILPANTTVESNGYRMLGIADVMQQPIEVGWLVEGVIPLESVGMVFGASGLGKSHIMLSMALNVALGRQWFGKDVEQGRVAVLVGEGSAGINKRLKAIATQHSLPIDANTPISFSDMPVGIDTKEGFANLVSVLDQLPEPPRLIIVDTLSRHIAASKENDNGDMAKFINQLDRLKQRYNATVIMVHHTGKGEQETARGAYALKANIDFSFSVKGADKPKLISLECDKMKDGDDNLPPMRFEVIGVEV
jgi:putative DNA primase/helicase